MRIRKHEHATVVLEEGPARLIIDPGGFTTPLAELNRTAAVVITHRHPDHLSPDQLAQIRRYAPSAPFFAPADVAEMLPDAGITVVEAGDSVTVTPFTMRFFGGSHQIIHPTVPSVDNLGVLVNDRFYYPGDSYAVPDGYPVEVLAAPLGAPWLRIADAMDFVLALRPEHAFGTHDMTLSVIGKGMHRERLRWATERHGGQFHDLEPGDHLEI